jgi:hypothetical protein
VRTPEAEKNYTSPWVKVTRPGRPDITIVNNYETAVAMARVG